MSTDRPNVPAVSRAGDRLAAAVAQGHEDAVQVGPQEDGPRLARIHVTAGGLHAFPIVERVHGGWQSGRHYYADADVIDVQPITPAPVSSPAGEDAQERAGAAEVAEVDRLIETVLCDHRITTRQTTIGEIYGCEAPDCDYDTQDWTAWEEHVAPHVRAALAASLLRQDPPQVAGEDVETTRLHIGGRRAGKESTHVKAVVDECERRGLPVTLSTDLAGEDVERVARERMRPILSDYLRALLTEDEALDAIAALSARPVEARDRWRAIAIEERDKRDAALARVEAAEAEVERARNLAGRVAGTQVRLTETLIAALGLDPDDDEGCVGDCEDDGEGAEHLLWHLIQQRDELRAVIKKVRALADDMDERGWPGANDSEHDKTSRRQIREDAKRLCALLDGDSEGRES